MGPLMIFMFKMEVWQSVQGSSVHCCADLERQQVCVSVGCSCHEEMKNSEDRGHLVDRKRMAGVRSLAQGL